MFDDMTAAIREDTLRILCHIRVEEKVEREPAAKVTGTNRDDSAARAPTETPDPEDLPERSVSVWIR